MNEYQSYKQYKPAKPSGGDNRKKNKPKDKVSKNTKKQKTNKNKTTTHQNNKKSVNNKQNAQILKQNKIKEAQRIAKQKEHKENLKKQKLIEKQNKKIEKQKRKELFQHALKSNKKILLGACFVVFYIIISMFVLYNNSNISQLQYKVNEIKRDIEKEKNYLNELEVERESTYKSETIENYAKYRLNMIYPSKEQIVYIKVD